MIPELLTIFMFAHEKTTSRDIFVPGCKGSFGTLSQTQVSKLFPDSQSCVLHTSEYQWSFVSFLYQHPLITVEFPSSNLHSESNRRIRIRGNISGHLFQTYVLWTKLKKCLCYFFNSKWKQTKKTKETQSKQNLCIISWNDLSSIVWVFHNLFPRAIFAGGAGVNRRILGKTYRKKYH